MNDDMEIMYYREDGKWKILVNGQGHLPVKKGSADLMELAYQMGKEGQQKKLDKKERQQKKLDKIDAYLAERTDRHFVSSMIAWLKELDK